MESMRLLSYAQAELFYDTVGAMLDTQAFYEARAQRALADHLELWASRAVVELGCGTGRFAAELLEARLPLGATYLGIDISRTMVALTKSRLGTIWEPRGGHKVRRDAPRRQPARSFRQIHLQLCARPAVGQ
jgi:SAM-dependent methyltransferase